jgi:hypothetical protein
MKADTRREIKRTARKLYRDGRISLEMAVWAMKNAGYTGEETAKWLKLTGKNTALQTGAGIAPDINTIGRRAKSHDDR